MVEIKEFDKLNKILKDYYSMVTITRYDGDNRELRLDYAAGGGPEENVTATVIFDEAVIVSLASIFRNSRITYKEIKDYAEAKSIIKDDNFADDEEFPTYYKLYLLLKNDIPTPYYVLAHAIRGTFEGPAYYEDQIRNSSVRFDNYAITESFPATTYKRKFYERLIPIGCMTIIGILALLALIGFGVVVNKLFYK